MIIELKQMFRDARWFWFFVAATMCTGTGVRYFFRGTGGNAIIARVNGRGVSQKAFLSQVQKEENYRRRLQQFGIKMGPVNQEMAFKSCLRDAMVLGLADNLGIEVGDELVAENIKKMMPKDLFGKDGVFNEEAYRVILAQSGENNVEAFEREQREDMARALMTSIIQKSYFSPSSFGEKPKEGGDEKRSFEILKIDAEKTRKDLETQGLAATEEELLAWYENNKNKYKDAGFASLKAICLNTLNVGRKIVVSDKEIADYYNRYKQSKYTTQKNYTVDFWMFEKEPFENLSDENVIALKKLTDECEEEAILEDFSLCEKKALENYLSLTIARNHNVVLGEQKFSTKLENVILGIKEVGSFSKPVEIDGKIYLVRLVKKEASVVKEAGEVKTEIVATIRRKKEEYEVNRIAGGVLRVIKEAKGANINANILDSFADYQEMYPGCLIYEELSMGEGAEAVPVTKKLPDVDSLEVGRVGRVADSTMEVIYVVDKVIRRKPKGFITVKETIEKEWFEQKISEKLEGEATAIKKELLALGEWPEKYVEDVSKETNITREEAMKEGAISLEITKVIFDKLFSPRQVYKSVNKKEAVILKLTEEAFCKDLEHDRDEENVYTEKILEEKLKSATIEEYLSGELGRYKKGRG